MKHPDYDKAFAPTPEIVGLSIDAAFRKGEKVMKFRHKLTAMLSAAAVIAITFAVIALALPTKPAPDVLSQPPVTAESMSPPEKLTAETEESSVYYNIKGVYYHFTQYCSGMMGASLHPLSEAQADGKKPCPVCVLGERDSNVTIYPAPTESQETTFVLGDAQRTPADLGTDIFVNVFGAHLFDVLADYEYISVLAEGTADGDGVLCETIRFVFAENGITFTPVTITVERRYAEILSGNIAMDSIYFSGDAFREQCSPWYQNLCAAAADTMENLPVPGTGSGGIAEQPLSICAYFDSEHNPSVCVLDYETDGGFVSLGFDIADDQAVLSNMNYSATKA